MPDETNGPLTEGAPGWNYAVATALAIAITTLERYPSHNVLRHRLDDMRRALAGFDRSLVEHVEGTARRVWDDIDAAIGRD